jgi:superfamily II DNA or RNA helicase
MESKKASLTARAYIGKRGYILRKNKFSEDEIKELKSDLHVKPNVMGDYGTDAEPYDVFLENDNKIYIPKFYGIEKFGNVPVEFNTTPPGRDIQVEFNLQLRPEQKVPAEKVMEAYYNHGGGILSLYCGAGKTIMALYFIAQLKKKTMVIVHKEFLMNQWKERIEFALPGAKVGIIQGNKCDTDCDIVIAMLQTLSMKQFPRETFDDIGHVIIDECHRIPSKVFSRALFKINSPYMLGLSATPNRKDGLTKVLKWFIGDIIYSLKARKERTIVEVERLMCESELEEYNKEVTGYNGNVQIATMINNICGYYKRTFMYMKRVVDELNKHPSRQFLVLSDRKQHLLDMEKCALQMGVTSIGYYVGGMKEKDLKKSESCRLLLGTFPMANEGLDIKSLNGLVIASPKSDIIQTVGRILRQKHEINPLIIDVVDQFSVFNNQAKKRFEFFRKNKYQISDLTVNIDDNSTGNVLKKKEYKHHLGTKDDSSEEEELCNIDDSDEDVKEGVQFEDMGFDKDFNKKKRVYKKKVVKKEETPKSKEDIVNSILSNWSFSDTQKWEK